MMPVWHLNRGTYLAQLGLIPHWLSLDDPRPASEQINDHYAHGGGWKPFTGFTLINEVADPLTWAVTYPGDPAYPVMAYVELRNETIIILPHSWVGVVEDGHLKSIARVD